LQISPRYWLTGPGDLGEFQVILHNGAELKLSPNFRAALPRLAGAVGLSGKRLCASLTTLELTPNGRNTKLKNTTQLASFIGQDMVNGHSTGTNASLDNLVKFFAK